MFSSRLRMVVNCTTEITITNRMKMPASAVETPYCFSEIPRWMMIWVTV